ncbi:uncharacterized protein LOC129287931 isoform X2 [Prosopis cineraria]|uniref:uncharacterized protein LOC129287931 isoform X2 n=1 Tax=Prosopis cineraria TaxID=364024 RepID=UPI00240FA85A|nr:uncharacterized protein LOC129287931 isoform X2 [Prosopis cineraria]
MGVDYYKILRVDRSANGDDLKKAYRKLVMKWHPDKKLNNKKEVLTDPQKRGAYDQYGEEGLKGQAPPPGTGGFSGGPTTFPVNPRSPDDIISELFRFMDETDGRAGGSTFRRGVFGDEFFSSFMSGGGDGSANIPRKGAAIVRTLLCSLKDLYKGTRKKMKISRDVVDANGQPIPVQEILPIEIKPGWKKGTKITFPEKGNEQRGLMPADLIFIIDEKPHSVFRRDNNDLISTQGISLVEALTGYVAQLTTLDGRNLTIPINSIMSPSYEEVVEGEGMPIPKDPSKKGNLRIKFNIKFPSRMSSKQKIGFRNY